jgi:spore maturation protein CgeB
MPASGRFMTTKAFEYMACNRLCFCYLDEEYMFKSRLLFEDGKEIIYFKTLPELEEKYRYYLEHPKEAEKIAQAGYEKVRKYHNTDIRAKRFVQILLHHANGGKYDESYNNVSLFGGKSVSKI